MKVLYLAPSSDDGKLAAYTFLDEEIRALGSAGVDVYFIAMAPLAQELEGLEATRIHVRVVPPGKTLSQLLNTLSFLWKRRKSVPPSLWLQPFLLLRLLRLERFAYDLARQEAIEVVHSNFGSPGGFGGSLATLNTTTCLVAALRGMDVLMDRAIDYGLRRSRAYDQALRFMLRNADRTIHVSDYIRRQAIALGAPESRAVTVRKGVDCDRFDAPLTKEKRPRLSILTVGGLIKRKGIDTILEALALLTDTHEFSFVVIGKGPELTRLKELSDRLRLSERTQFVGYVSRKEIPARFAACDIFVLASTWEASGNVLLEAMATGRPVVCTASGGPPEYVDDGVTGYVVPVGEPRPMAEKIRRLLDDANLRHEFGKRGWERARREFTYARMINETLRVYQEAIATRRARDS